MRVSDVDATSAAADPESGSADALVLLVPAAEKLPLADVQDGADHNDPRTTRRYDRRRHLLDRSPAYTLADRLSGDVPADQ
jgi:hypothetical protein